MESERKGKPVAAMGGMYAKAKQRVLNKLGRRTTLTKNPRVDFISRRVEDIRGKKENVTRLATQVEAELQALRASSADLNRAMLDAYRDELGDRRWDDGAGGYVRVLHPEEKRLVADMERALIRATGTLDKVLGTYSAHLKDVAAKPLTFHTPEETASLEAVMVTKLDYKEVRTLYSDAMIDADAQLATGADPSPALQQKVDDAKKAYEDMSERLCEDALKYEHIYREELSQRVAAHFVAEQHLVRGAVSSLSGFYPYTRGLTLDWQEMRAARRAALANREDEDAGAARLSGSLPRAGSSPPLASAVSAVQAAAGRGGNPFGDGGDSRDSHDAVDDSSAAASSRSAAGKGVAAEATKVMTSASAAAASAAAAVRKQSKGLTEMLGSYAPGGGGVKGAVKTAEMAKKADDGWANIKL
jgi:hypothetical protein